MRAPRISRARATLGVVTHVPHWIGEDGLPCAYEPYVREMRIWANLFPRVIVCAPVATGPVSGARAPYARPNIEWRPVRYHMQIGRLAPLRRLAQMPSLAYQVNQLIGRCDLILVRSPGHPALVANLLVRLRRKRSITKWAGLFGPYDGERAPSRVERWLLERSGPRHPVLIYGPSSRVHLVSFLPALMSCDELAKAQQFSTAKTWDPPWRILSVGRLLPVKGFDLAIRGLSELRARRPAVDWRFTMVGDGPARPELEDLARRGGIADRVHFTGALPFAEVQRRYAEAHVVIMPGVKEGWPKTIVEAWAHGAVPVAASVGLTPWLLQDDDAGVLFEPQPAPLAAALEELLSCDGRVRRISSGAFARAGALSLETFEQRLAQTLAENCGVE